MRLDSMKQKPRLLDFHCQRNTVLLTLLADFDDDARADVEEETDKVLLAVCEPAEAVFLLDFEGQRRCRSAGLMMLLGVLWKQVKQSKGRLLLCNPAPSDLETLKRMRLDRIWPVFASREAALESLVPAPTPAVI